MSITKGHPSLNMNNSSGKFVAVSGGGEEKEARDREERDQTRHTYRGRIGVGYALSQNLK